MACLFNNDWQEYILPTNETCDLFGEVGGSIDHVILWSRLKPSDKRMIETIRLSVVEETSNDRETYWTTDIIWQMEKFELSVSGFKPFSMNVGDRVLVIVGERSASIDDNTEEEVKEFIRSSKSDVIVAITSYGANDDGSVEKLFDGVDISHFED